MKKIFTLIICIVLSITILYAQEAPPQAFSFKATIKDNKNNEIVLKTISLRISILRGTANGNTVYSESFRPTTNLYSQVDVEIGHGSIISGIFSAIDWTADSYFLKIEVDTKGGTNYQVMSVSQLLSVPYALYSGAAANSFSGNYIDLIGTPNLALIATTGSFNDLLDRPALFSGDYNALFNKPNLFSGYYNDLLNKPTLFDGAWGSLTGTPTFAKISTSGSWEDLINTPVTLSGYGIADAISTTHPAYMITAENISNWNIAAGWGNHADLYRPIHYVPAWDEISDNPFHFNTPALDQLLKYDGTSWVNFTPSFLLSEVDGDVTNEIQTLSLTSNELSISKAGDNKIIFANWDIDAVDDVTTSGDQSIAGNKTFTGLLTSTLSANNMVVSNVADPLANQDAATKAYVDVLEARISTLETQVTGLLNLLGVDIDGDGYGVAEGDCDDANQAIHPGAIEVCGDGIDQDCDGSDLTCNYSAECLPLSSDPIPTMIRLINNKRILRGLSPLAPDPRLVLAAQKHAEYLVLLGSPSHIGVGESTFVERLADEGYTAPRGELVGGTFTDPVVIFTLWFNDSIALNNYHNLILLQNAKHLGVGYSQGFWVVEFGATLDGPTCSAEETDKDGDGYTVTEGDCDDNDASINPGATDACGDGIDQNCDGAIDEGDGNNPPVANANGPYVITEQENLWLSGTMSDIDQKCNPLEALTAVWDLYGNNLTPYLSGIQRLVPWTGVLDKFTTRNQPINIKLVVTDITGRTAESVTQLTIYDRDFMPCFDVSPSRTAGCSETLAFDASCTSHPDPRRTFVTYEWDFENATYYSPSTDPNAFPFNPTSAGKSQTHVYSTPGTYRPTLRVQDDHGFKMLTQLEVTVITKSEICDGLDNDCDGEVDEGCAANDADGDGVPDALDPDLSDPDSDNDGLNDGIEDANHNGVKDPTETNPLDADTDDDGISDGEESTFSTISLDADTDDDGLNDGLEIGLRGLGISGGSSISGVTYVGTHPSWGGGDTDPSTHTNPLVADTDADGVMDGTEDRDHDGARDTTETNPLDADTDDDGLSDAVEDKDHDGVVDALETNPLDADTDGDLLLDGAEDLNKNGSKDPNETDPRDYDTDGDYDPDGTDCKPLDSSISQTELEIFNHIDDNCNGSVDEGFVCTPSPYEPNESCSQSIYFGEVVDTEVAFISRTGNATSPDDVDWFQALATDGTNFLNENFKVRINLVSNPGGAFVFDVYKSDCSTPVAYSVTEYVEDGTLGAEDTSSYYIKVYLLNTSQPSHCGTYTLRMSNGEV